MTKEISQNKLRKIALKKANYQCQRCGNTHDLQMHHLRYPGTSLDDVIILCRYCHYLTHYGHSLNTKKITKEKLEPLCKQGKTLAEMATIFQTSYGSIRQRLIRWGLKTHKRDKLTAKDKKTIKYMVLIQNYTLQETADKFNITRARVHQIVNEKPKIDKGE